MENQRMVRAKRYLTRFDEILDQMADKMLSQKVTGSITIDFITCMIPHHQAAIFMSENLLLFTSYEPLRKIAQGIIQMQTRGIEQMKEILSTTYGYRNMQQDVKCYIDKYLEITKNMIEKMKNSPRCMNINLDFVGEMIPHHEGAISMCENLLRYRIDPRLKQVADTIIREQSQGVKDLEEIRKYLCRR